MNATFFLVDLPQAGKVQAMAYMGDVWRAAADAWKSRRVEVFRHSMEFQRVVREGAKMGYSAEDAFVTAEAGQRSKRAATCKPASQ